MKFSDLLFGTQPKIKQTPNFSPQQQSFLDMILSQLQQPTGSSISWLGDLFNDEGFQDYERPMMEQFNQQIIPGITERFAAQGSNKGSSGLNQSLAQAARGLSSDLGAQRGNLRMNAINALQNYGQTGLARQTTPFTTSGTQGATQSLMKLLPLLLGGL